MCLNSWLFVRNIGCVCEVLLHSDRSPHVLMKPFSYVNWNVSLRRRFSDKRPPYFIVLYLTDEGEHTTLYKNVYITAQNSIHVWSLIMLYFSHTRMHTCTQHTHTHIHTYTHTHTLYTCTHARTHTHTHTHVHVHTHACTHACTHTHTQKKEGGHERGVVIGEGFSYAGKSRVKFQKCGFKGQWSLKMVVLHQRFCCTTSVIWSWFLYTSWFVSGFFNSRTRPSCQGVIEHKGVNLRLKYVTQVQQQRPESATVTLIWTSFYFKVVIHQDTLLSFSL